MTEKLQNHRKLQHSLCSVKGFGQKQTCAAGSGSKGSAPTLPVQVSRRWMKTPEVFQCVNGGQFVLIAHQDECIGYLTMMLCLPHFPSEGTPEVLLPLGTKASACSDDFRQLGQETSQLFSSI